MIEDIMQADYKTVEIDGYKKYENRHFSIFCNKSTFYVLDKRSFPHNIHMDLKEAHKQIVVGSKKQSPNL